MPKAANMSKKRDAAEEVPSRPKRARTAAPSDTMPTTAKTTAVKEPSAKKPIAKNPAASKKPAAAKKAAAPKASKPVKEEKPAKPAKKPVLTNGEPTSKKRSSLDLAESATKRVKANGDAPKKRIAKPKAPAKAAAKSPIEIAKKLPAINSAPTQRMMVFACGEGSAGELGMGPKKSVDVKRPRLNVLLDAKTVGVVQISTGGMHCVALTHDNKILTWGVNDQCALGRDTDWDGGLRDMDSKSDCSDDSDDSDDSDTGLNPKESTPDSVAGDAFPAGTKFVHVAAGDSCSFALTDTGLVYGWGTFRVSWFWLNRTALTGLGRKRHLRIHP
jgi:regulator of chromosome condensation